MSTPFGRLPGWPACERTVRAMHPDWPRTAFLRAARTAFAGDTLRVTVVLVEVWAWSHLPANHPGRDVVLMNERAQVDTCASGDEHHVALP